MMISLDNNANTWIKDKIWAHVLKWVDMEVFMTSYISVADPGDRPRGASFPYLSVWKTVRPPPFPTTLSERLDRRLYLVRNLVTVGSGRKKVVSIRPYSRLQSRIVTNNWALGSINFTVALTSRFFSKARVTGSLVLECSLFIRLVVGTARISTYR